MTSLSNDLACLTFLEAIDFGGDIADGVPVIDLETQGLIFEARSAWALTPLGELRLRNLRSSLRTDLS
jgi:hypothetical protein